MPEGVIKCSYFWTLDHYLKWHYQAFHDNLNSIWIHIGDNLNVCLGPYIPGAKLVFMRQEKSSCESIFNIEKLRYLSLFLANAQNLRIGDANLNPYFSDDKIEYIFLAEPIKTGVLAARSNQLKPNP